MGHRRTTGGALMTPKRPRTLGDLADSPTGIGRLADGTRVRVAQRCGTGLVWMRREDPTRETGWGDIEIRRADEELEHV